jgi:RNA polymerase sigma-70 factor, ECF subfamily
MTEGHDEDASLMLRVQRGDRAAFESLVDRHRLAIFNFVHRTLRDVEESEDVAQQVFVQVWKAAGRYRVQSRFTTWLFTIARNLCLNELRRRGRHPVESLDAPFETADGEVDREPPDTTRPGVTDEMLLAELEHRIEESLADLPEAQRSAILLFREKELAYEEIAEVLGVSVSATKSLIHRGRETLRRRLKAYLRTGEWSPGDALDARDEADARRATFPTRRF